MIPTARHWQLLYRRGAIGTLLALACLLAIATAAVAADDEERQTLWSQTQFFHLFDPDGAKVEDYRVFLNNAPAPATRVRVNRHRSNIHIRVTLDHGENMVRVEKAKQVFFQAAVFAAPGYESDLVPEEAVPRLFHTGKGESACAPCHRMEPKRGDVVPKATAIKEQICYPCHAHSFDNLPKRHKPALDQWRCLLCHQRDFADSDLSPDAPLRYTIAEGAEVAPLCFKCHKKKRKQIEGYSVIHGPIGMDGCTMCHDPHGSKWRRLLQNDATTLCVNCHEMQDVLEQPHVHGVIKKQGCTGCHDPHGSSYALQLKSKLNDLCYHCHGAIYKQRRNHPVQGHPVSGPKDPGAPESPFTCISCHSPHASEFEKLLPEEDVMMMCTNCHAMGR